MSRSQSSLTEACRELAPASALLQRVLWDRDRASEGADRVAVRPQKGSLGGGQCEVIYYSHGDDS